MKKKTFLLAVIDDDKIYQITTKKNIMETGTVTDILQFFDGEQALGYISEHRDISEKLPEIILLDLNMPYLDGWQFLEELEKLDINPGYSPAIYIVTSSANSEDVEKAGQYEEVSGYLIKPVTKEEFSNLIKKAL